MYITVKIKFTSRKLRVRVRFVSLEKSRFVLSTLDFSLRGRILFYLTNFHKESYNCRFSGNEKKCSRTSLGTNDCVTNCLYRYSDRNCRCCLQIWRWSRRLSRSRRIEADDGSLGRTANASRTQSDDPGGRRRRGRPHIFPWGRYIFTTTEKDRRHLRRINERGRNKPSGAIVVISPVLRKNWKTCESLSVVERM